MRDEVIAMLQRLPADVTLEEIEYGIFMLRKAKLARQAIAKGDVCTHDQVKEIIRSRWRTNRP